MTVRIKTGGGTLPALGGGSGNPYGGVWTTVAAAGNLRLKWGGASWITPAIAYAKSGAVGTGSWVDTGYRGYPNPPTSFGIHYWDYSQVQAVWAGPDAGGAPVQDYHFVLTNEAGTWLYEEYGTDGFQAVSVSQNTRYRLYVRSRSTNGLFSGFVGPINVGIGYPAVNNYGYVNRERGWNSEVVGGYRNMDDPLWVGVPDSIHIYTMAWRNLQCPASGVTSPGTNRTVNYIFNGGDFGPINNNLGTIPKGHNYDYPLDNAPPFGGAWGLIARGVGWSTTGNPSLMMYADALWIYGIETYANYELISTTPAVGNYYY